ncbi:NADH:flavin oxidoreductase/NADH oxidase [Paraflavitalea sp. CAU 1676]|uniref:NADH:flavin oxidoreductase/NADH oxidase n=1 Tax=Paraflavitalea sp. CAU 1676 TaxID=3032598 RepID=UPI0023DA5F91|nr:NADH:flavin oxidoreductase/NADH oxidase [Paraflavitalea sp. CAU 1676]MDF2190981.1 NADH:flavin oxidoreductase/NADH oxidase [Paraflavitalea sp. CAU 1676]
MAALFSPFTLKSITFRNRIVISPMCQYSSVDGFATDWHLVHLGAGQLVGPASSSRRHLPYRPKDGSVPTIWKQEHLEKLRSITAFIREQGAVPGIQLAHAGRKASSQSPWKGGQQISPEAGGWQTVAPSAIPFRPTDPVPLALDFDGINKVIRDFKVAAARAAEAGYQVLELHAAHGYLIHEFLSPLANQRTDRYGGSFENRIRFLLEVVETVKEVWPPQLPLLVRISATDWADGGWNELDSVVLAGILKERGVDLIDCSTGGIVPGITIPTAPGYQVRFAEKLRREARIPTGAVGMITTAQQAEDIIGAEQADLVIIARQSLRDPYFPLHAAKELGVEIDWPSQYLRAKN